MPSATYSPTTRVWLNLENASPIQKGANTGQIGKYLRAGSTYCDETILQFLGVSALDGATIDDVWLRFTLGMDNWPIAQTGYLFEQDKTAPSSWTSPNPKFSDFASTAWATQLDTVALASSNSNTEYTFNSSSLTTLVQSWVDDSNDNWGVIIGANPVFFSYYATLTTASLDISYTPAVTDKPVNALHHYKMRRR